MMRLSNCLVVAALLLSGCTSAVRYSFPPPSEEQPTADRDDTPRPKQFAGNLPSRIDMDRMNRIIATYMKTPYQEGGSGTLGLDCSGFVYVVYRDYDGTRLPLTVQALYRLDKRVGADELAYGDLVFFRTNGRKVSHVGLYIGEGKFVHASESRGVTIDDLASDDFSSQYTGARRVK